MIYFFRLIRKTVQSFCMRLMYLFQLAWKTSRGHFVGLVICAALNGIIPSITSLISANILNLLSSTDTIILFSVEYSIIVLVVLQFLQRIIANLYTTITTIFGSLISHSIREMIMTKAQNIQLEDFDDPDFYSVLENANKEANARPVEIMSSFFSLVTTVLSMLSYTVIISAFSPILALIMIASGVPNAIASYLYRKRNYQYNKDSTKLRRQAAYYSKVCMSPSNIKEVRIYNLYGWFKRKYTLSFSSFLSGLHKIVFSEFRWECAYAFFTSLLSFTFYAILSRNTLNGYISIGEYSLYISALSTIFHLVFNAADHSSTIYSGTLFVDNLLEFLHREEKQPTTAHPISIENVYPHIIEVRNVSFSYPGKTVKVLDNVSLTVKSGDQIAIVGLNGSGKTTLMKLILRLYDPTEGAILLDNRDIREYSLIELQKIYSVVFQDYGRYADTLSNNIYMGNVNSPLDINKIINATSNSCLNETVERLQAKWDTSLTRLFDVEGTDLSIGQWQKIAIARALYRDAPIQIYDEPTSSIDPLSEQAVLETILRKDHNKIRFIISHRLSTISTVDRIIVMEQGKIIEVGTHCELIELHGKYYTLFHKQANPENCNV